MTPTLNLTSRHAQCKSCKESIVWAESSKTGKPMPVNYSPDAEKGNVLLAVERGLLVAAVLSGAQLTGARAAGTQLRTAHFATCVNADKHRRAR